MVLSLETKLASTPWCLATYSGQPPAEDDDDPQPQEIQSSASAGFGGNWEYSDTVDLLAAVLATVVVLLGTLEAIGEDIETFGFEHQVHFENCTAPEVGVPGKSRRLLSSLGNFTLHIWTAGESHARLPCWHVLQGWHASKDWC